MAGSDLRESVGDGTQGLTQRAYESLRDAILAHELPPGTRLSVPLMAQRLGVSRSPAREAIAKIASEGLATVSPNRGAVVAALERSDLVEIYRIREVLEGLASRLAAVHADEDSIARLESLVAQHAELVARGDVEHHYTADALFHSAVREIAESPRLSESLDRLQGQIRLGMHTTHRSPGGMAQALREHRSILAAISARSPEFAETAARLHIHRLITELQRPGAAGDSPQTTNSSGVG